MLRVILIKKSLAFLVLGILFLFAALGTGFLLFFPPASSTVLIDQQPIYQGSSKRKEIALTCNVFWGEEFLPQMLAVLERYEVPVTFFVGGVWAEKFPDMTRELLEKGHEIGNHGYSHPHPDRLSKEDNLKDIIKCEKVLKEITGKRPTLYTPPYGERGPAVLQAAEEAGYRTILWSIDTVDWKHPPPEAIINKVVKNAHNGAIVLMHPTAPTVYALPQVIESLQEQGYNLVTVSQLLRDKKKSDKKF